MKKYISEFIATYGLVFCGTGAIVINEVSGGAVTHLGIAITFGLIVMAMIYTFGERSGAHMNPAVTISFALYKVFPKRLVLPYLISQTLGALAASGTLKLLFPTSIYLGATLPAGNSLQSFTLECILSFFLMLTILSVAEGGKEKGMLAGIAIGAVVLLEALFAGPISGASMNPVRSLGPAVVSNSFQHLWIYIFAPIAGMMAASFTHYSIKT